LDSRPENPLASNPAYMNRNIIGANNQLLARFTPVMTPICLYCGVTIKEDDGLFYAFDMPYCGVIHRNCAPFFNFMGEWPHPFPIRTYQEKGKIIPRT
jgi:hypothetical protein